MSTTTLDTATSMNTGMQPSSRHPHVANNSNSQYLASADSFDSSRRRKSIPGTNTLMNGMGHDSGLPSFSNSYPLGSSLSGVSSEEKTWSIRNVRSIAPSPGNVKFIFLCLLWYATSALSSNTGKVILNNFRYPVTLTIIQFFFVAGYCWLLTDGSRMLGIAQAWKWVASQIMGLFGGSAGGGRRGTRSSLHSRSISLGIDGSGLSGSRLKKPTRAILAHTCPMAAFQVMGHIFASMAISRIPVSTVHTIKVSRTAVARILDLTTFAFDRHSRRSSRS
jgi:solute carrier family 35 protein E1